MPVGFMVVEPRTAVRYLKLFIRLSGKTTVFIQLDLVFVRTTLTLII